MTKRGRNIFFWTITSAIVLIMFGIFFYWLAHPHLSHMEVFKDTFFWWIGALGLALLLYFGESDE